MLDKSRENREIQIQIEKIEKIQGHYLLRDTITQIRFTKACWLVS